MKSIKLFCSVFLLGLLISLSSRCKKQETDKHDITPTTIGEKTFQIGTYQTWSEVIDFAHDKGYIVAGTFSARSSDIRDPVAFS
jgi:hypothetical protein